MRKKEKDMKKYKLFGKIPVFDLIIILVLIAVGFAAVRIVLTSKSGNAYLNSESKTVRYTIDFYNLSMLVKGVPEPGEHVYDSLTNNEIGKVVSVTTRPFVSYSFNMETGETVATEYTDRQFVTIVVEAVATISDRETQINNIRIGMGKVITVNMPSLCASGVIIEIEEVTGNDQ